MTIKKPEFKKKIVSKSKQKNDYPPMYKVILHNDDYTSMDFVIEILTTVFGKSFNHAFQIMLNIHKQGRDVCGLFIYEIAETKINTVHSLARDKGYPLKSTMEKE
ncbi:MAG: ATP-dependent Clp protease adaptor ClpS [Desulfobacteraceae bacterium 4572_130]|nr:MAG: ATP-dependent Clp protease adaptor ClpS [Desulfobacteraceae bacterium 4572_130]